MAECAPGNLSTCEMTVRGWIEELQSMVYQKQNILFDLLVCSKEIRDYLFDVLQRSGYRPRPSIGLDELLNALKGRRHAIVFLDTEAVVIYGMSIYSKIKAASPGSRSIVLCDQARRDLIKEAMEHGSYGCILEPYAEWEVLTMVRHILSDIRPGRRKSGKSGKEPPAVPAKG